MLSEQPSSSRTWSMQDAVSMARRHPTCRQGHGDRRGRKRGFSLAAVLAVGCWHSKKSRWKRRQNAVNAVNAASLRRGQANHAHQVLVLFRPGTLPVYILRSRRTLQEKSEAPKRLSRVRASAVVRTAQAFPRSVRIRLAGLLATGATALESRTKRPREDTRS